MTRSSEEKASIRRQDGECEDSEVTQADAVEMLATSDIDPVDVALHEAVVPQPSKRQWILTMSPDERDYMLRYVSLAISRTGGMTPVTRLMIGTNFASAQDWSM